jgi:hypothetical protein
MFADRGLLTSSRPVVTARHLAIGIQPCYAKSSIGSRIFADTFEIEIAFDEIGEHAGRQRRSPQLFGDVH